MEKNFEKQIKVRQGKVGWETRLRERNAFAIYGTGLSIFFVIIGSFLQQFYLINAAVPAAVVGLIFLIVKIWDGVNDPMLGVLVDKVRLKKGKYLPWMRMSTFLLPIAAVLLFLVPTGVSLWIKAMWLLIGYMIYDVASTMTEIPYYAVATAMTKNPSERSNIISISRVIGAAFALVVVFIPTMYQSIGWPLTMTVFAIIAMVTMLPGCFIIKERHKEQSEKPPKVKELLKYLISNKYLLIFFISAIVFGLTNTAGSMANIFAIYNLGSEDMIIIVLGVTFVPGVFAIFILNQLVRKYDKLHILFLALMMTILLSVLIYFVGYENLLLFFILTFIRGFFLGFHTMLFFLFTPDLSEYGTYITGMHAEGASFSMQSFASKILGALSGSVALFILAGFGYIEGEVVTQPEQALNGIWILISLFPAFGAIVQGTILAVFYKLRDRHVRVMMSANHGDITYAQAERVLNTRFPRKVTVAKDENANYFENQSGGSNDK